MRLLHKPPAMPAELLDRFGAPEQTFGPNVRFRALSVICGLILAALGVLFVMIRLAPRGVRLPLGDPAGAALGVPLLVIGAVAIFGPRMFPTTWLFVCPNGLVRSRGAAWDSLDWSEADRFEDATLTQNPVAIRQCQIVTTKGAAWGFLADWFADYNRLTEVLQRKMEEHRDSPRDCPRK
jgi:hypothetical protein